MAQFSFCAVGDVLLDRGVRYAIQSYGVDYPFTEVKSIICAADISFFNLECPISEKGKGSAVSKKYSFRSDPSFALGLANAGFDIASVANNHIYDQGENGFVGTMRCLDSSGIRYCGGGTNLLQAFEPTIIEKNGETIAFFAFVDLQLGAATLHDDAPCPAFGQAERLISSVRNTKRLADNIVVSIHWGRELDSLPSRRQIELAHRVIDAGANLVIGHHPHVLQGIEIYHDVPIIYSLGNFVFDNSAPDQRRTAIFRCNMSEGKIDHAEMIPIAIDKCRPTRATDSEKKLIEEKIKRLSSRLGTRFVGTELIIN